MEVSTKEMIKLKWQLGEQNINNTYRSIEKLIKEMIDKSEHESDRRHRVASLGT